MSGLDSGNLRFPVCELLRDQRFVLSLLSLLGVNTAVLKRSKVTAALEADGSDEALDLRRLSIRLSALLLLACNLPSDDKFANVILLGEVEEATNLGSSLRAETLGEDIVCEPWNGNFTLLDDNKREPAKSSPVSYNSRFK